MDPKAEAMYGYSPYNAMGCNPVSFNDPEGDIIPAILIGALIGAGVSGATAIATNAVAGNNLFQGVGKSMLMGAAGGAIGAGIGGVFAGSAFGQSTRFGILNNMASNAATSVAFGQDITLGSLAGSVAGGFVAGQLPQFTGVKGGSIANAFAEIGYKSVSGAITGAVGGGIGAAIDGRDIGQGILNGAKHGAIGGGVQAGLNILTMGTTYVPENVEQYGDFGRYMPVYRRGTFITNSLFPGGGVALGRNLVTNLKGYSEDYGHYLRAHESAHFLQQRFYGFGKMYSMTIRDYLKYGQLNTYSTPNTLEWGAQMHSLHRLGYYYTIDMRRISF